MGVGSNHPKVMIVIPAPSKEQPILIDGLILEYLEKNIKAYGINKSDLYITPQTKCGRKATKKAIKACEDWLIHEYQIFKPKLTILLVDDEELMTDTVRAYPTTLYNLTNRTKDDQKWTKDIFSNIQRACITS